MRRLVALAATLLAVGCPGEPEPTQPKSVAGSVSPSARGSQAQAQASASPSGSSATSPAASASTSAAVEEPKLIERDASGLWGETIDFEYDGKDVKSKARAYTGRVFIHAKALVSKKPLPLVVFFHGLNRALIPHRWMGGGNEGDVRKIVSELIESGAIPPVVLAGPGSVEKEAVGGQASFPVFDYPKFLDQVDTAASGRVQIDRSRVVVTGHSGAGCSAKGGIVAAVEHAPLAVISIDTCMPGSLAESLGGANAATNIVVTWQTASWDREFGAFRTLFMKQVKAHPPNEGVLRELDHLPSLPKAHDATVKQTFDKWLPRILPP